MAKKLEYGIFDKHWNCVLGCREGKECAERCWLKRVIKRLEGSPNAKVREAHKGLVMRMPGGSLDAPQEWPLRWTGEVRLNEAHLMDPLRWRKPATVAAGFHGDVGLLPDEALDRIMAVAALCPQHRFFFLTKRPERIAEYMREDLSGRGARQRVYNRAYSISAVYQLAVPVCWPLPNVYLGFSASTPAEFDERWDHMRKLARAGWNTFVFLEPLLGPVDVSAALAPECQRCGGVGMIAPNEECSCQSPCYDPLGCLRWLVVGGESGPNARPMSPEWARSIRDQCAAAGTAFLFKQWGEWLPVDDVGVKDYGQEVFTFGDQDYLRVGKKSSGCLLDGREWQQLPEAQL